MEFDRVAEYLIAFSCTAMHPTYLKAKSKYLKKALKDSSISFSVMSAMIFRGVVIAALLRSNKSVSPEAVKARLLTRPGLSSLDGVRPDDISMRWDGGVDSKIDRKILGPLR